MECSGCGYAAQETQKVCPYCGTHPAVEAEPVLNMPPPQVVYVQAGTPPVAMAASSGKRIPAALLAFFFGGIGVHKFYLGHTSAGLVRVGLIFMTCGLAAYVLPIIAWAEALIYLLKSDEDFDRTYVVGKKSWF